MSPDEFEELKQFKEVLMNCAGDAATNLLYYDRKECDDLSRSDLERLIKNGIVTVEDVVHAFEATVKDFFDTK